MPTILVIFGLRFYFYATDHFPLFICNANIGLII